jgi:hypothetical protein
MNIDIKIPIIGFTLLVIITIYLTTILHKGHRVAKLISRKGYMLQLSIILIWSVIILKFNAFDYIKSPENLHRIRVSTTHGIIALVIASLAYVGLTIPTFWFVMLIAYFIDLPILGVY